MKALAIRLSGAVLVCLLSATAHAGGGSAPSSSMGAGSKIEKINKHAVKSVLVVRQLLAQNGAPGIKP